MRDIVFVLVTLGFFGLAAAYVAACSRIVGGEPIVTAPADEAERPERGSVAVR